MASPGWSGMAYSHVWNPPGLSRGLCRLRQPVWASSQTCGKVHNSKRRSPPADEYRMRLLYHQGCCATGQNQPQSHVKFKEWKNRLYFLKGGSTKYCGHFSPYSLSCWEFCWLRALNCWSSPEIVPFFLRKVASLKDTPPSQVSLQW